MRTRSLNIARMVISAVAVVAWGHLAAAQGYEPAEDGHELVQTYCADCHATEKTGDSPHATAPRFRDLHLRYDVDQLGEALVEGIVTHPEMPEFEFDPEQAEAIIAYLNTLGPAAWERTTGTGR